MQTSQLSDWTACRLVNSWIQLLTVVACFCRNFETLQTNECEDANKYAYTKTKTYQSTQSALIFKISTEAYK